MDSTAQEPRATPNGQPDVLCVQSLALWRTARAAERRITDMLDRRIAAEDVLLVVPNRNAAQVFSALAARGVEAIAFGALAHAVLSCKGAARAIGRSERVLTRAEEDVLFEDLKVSGGKVGRLREILKFFKKGLSEGSDANPDWLVNDEERASFSLLRSHLEERGAILSCERANVALRCLEDDRVHAALARPHVIVFGFTALDACGQRLVERLALETFTALGSPLDAGVPQIAYPHPQGLAELAERAGVPVDDLDAGDRDATWALHAARSLARHCRHGGPEPLSVPSARWDSAYPDLQKGAEGPLSLYPTPEDEYAGAAHIVSSWCAAGVDPEQVVVACPNRSTVRGAAAALSGAGLPVSVQPDAPFQSPDLRTEESCGAERFLAGLGLAADPHDAVCWRTWIGLGNWLLNSDAWEQVRRSAAADGRAPLEELDAPWIAGEGEAWRNEGERLARKRLAERVRAGRDLLDACRGLTGARLVDEVARRCGWEPGRSERTLLARAGSVDAAALAAQVRAELADAACPRDGVAVATFDECAGMCAQVVVVCGMVDGYLPCREACDEGGALDRRAKIMHGERLKLLRLLGTAERTIRFTAFCRTDLETAEHTRIDVGRIFARKGRRLATAHPSRLLAECEPADASTGTGA